MKKLIKKLALIIFAALIMTSCSNKFNQTPAPNAISTEAVSPSATSNNADSTKSPEATPETTPQATTEATVTPSPQTEKNNKEPLKVKAVYVSGYVAAARLDHFIELINKTELNAIVIDIKEERFMNYESQVPFVKEFSIGKKIYKPEEVLKKCHDNNIYVIGRIVTFKDEGLAKKKPELAIKKPNGEVWFESAKGGAWLNPYLTEAQDYNIDIAKEAVSMGFDEIQFDYVRFPAAKASEVDYGNNAPPKTDTISNFLKRASEEIKKVRDVKVSADIFGIVAESERDGNAIGQNFNLLGQHIDYISPMIYPSHYANDAKKGAMSNGVGQKINGVLFTKPDLNPYEVVYQSLLKIKSNISTAPEYKANVRPYLQDFTAAYLAKGYWQTYGVDQVRAQIKAVYDAGYEEWILWNAKNTYTEGALQPE